MNQVRSVTSVLLLLALAGCGAGDPDGAGAGSTASPSQLRQGSIRAAAAAANVSATFPGNLSQYSISNANLTVTDNLTGNVQPVVAQATLQFADATVSLDVDGGIPGQVYRLYQAAFNRKPDLAGLGAQINGMNNGLSLEQISQNFINSQEFANTYGNLDDTAFVTLLYANVLKRAPDAAGLAFHVGNLEGTNPGGRVLTRAVVLFGFSESAENKALVADAIRNGIEYIPFGTSAPSTPVASFAASYNGNIFEGDVGTMSMTVAASGAITATMHSIGYGLDLSGSGTIAVGGRFSFTLSGGDKSIVYTGSIAPASGLVTGFWTYNNSTVTGVFNAARQAVVVPLEFPQVQQIIQQRCVLCHGAAQAQDGIRLDSEARIRAQAQLIQQVAVDSDFMPYQNATNMTAAERAIVGKWIADGTPP